MLTQKKLSSGLPTGEFSKSLVGWVAKNSSALEQAFDKKYPRSRNKFNIVVRNIKGSKRTLVLTSTGEVKVDRKNSYKNVLTGKTLKKLGCPEV